MTATLAVAIPHSSWAPGRTESLARLIEDLGLDTISGTGIATVPAFGEVEYFLHDNRSERQVWSETIWTWGAKTSARHFLQVQNDVRVAPDGLFWRALHAMIEAHPDEIINLQSVHQAAPQLAAEGVRGYTTTEGLPGPAYVVPMPVLKEFLVWRKTALKDGSLQAITEDTLLGMFAMVTRRRIWSPVPTIVDHPGEVTSTYGNDKAERQRPLVRWDMMGAEAEKLADPAWWQGETRHLGRFYAFSIPELARRHVKGYSEADADRDRKDTGTHELRRLYHARRAKLPPPEATLFVCSPFHTGFSHEYVASILELKDAIESVEFVHEIQASVDPGFLLQEVKDLTRVRSRMLNLAKGSDCTHMLWLDADMKVGPKTILGMLQTRFDFVQTHYPRRDGRGYSIRWTKKITDQGGIRDEDIQRWTVPILSTGLGCTLLSRRCIEKMVAHYADEPDPPELEALVRGSTKSRREAIKEAYELGRSHGHRLVFDDFPKWEQPPKLHKTVALFHLMIAEDEVTGFRQLYGEDTAFCERWRALGEEVRLYVGEGSPVRHLGEKLYEGKIEDIGLRHGPMT